MGLTSKALSGESSPFHLAHERIALEWQAVGRSHGLQIHGSYDPWHVKVELRGERMVMKGNRHLMTRRGPLLEMGSPYQERVTLRSELLIDPEERLSVVRNSLWNSLERLLLDYRKLPIDQSYSYLGPVKRMEQHSDLLAMLISVRLSYFKLKGNHVFFELNELPKQREHLDLILGEMNKHFTIASHSM